MASPFTLLPKREIIKNIFFSKKTKEKINNYSSRKIKKKIKKIIKKKEIGEVSMLLNVALKRVIWAAFGAEWEPSGDVVGWGGRAGRSLARRDVLWREKQPIETAKKTIFFLFFFNFYSLALSLSLSLPLSISSFSRSFLRSHRHTHPERKTKKTATSRHPEKREKNVRRRWNAIWTGCYAQR